MAGAATIRITTFGTATLGITIKSRLLARRRKKLSVVYIVSFFIVMKIVVLLNVVAPIGFGYSHFILVTNIPSK